MIILHCTASYAFASSGCVSFAFFFFFPGLAVHLVLVRGDVRSQGAALLTWALRRSSQKYNFRSNTA